MELLFGKREEAMEFVNFIKSLWKWKKNEFIFLLSYSRF